MLDIAPGIAFVALAAVVLIWRTVQDGRATADRQDGAPVPMESRASGVVVGDFSGTAGGIGEGSAGVAAGGGACGADGSGGTPC